MLIKIFWVSLFKGTSTFLSVDHCENGIDKKCPYQWCEFAMQASISLRNGDFWCEYWLTSIISASILQHPLLGIIAEQASTQLWKLIVSLYTDSWINNVKSSEQFYLSRLHSHKTLAQSPSITTHGDKYYHWLYWATYRIGRSCNSIRTSAAYLSICQHNLSALESRSV